MKIKKSRAGGAVLASASLALMLAIGGTAGDANAGAVIVSGDIALGVNEEGHLNTLDPNGVVLSYNAGGYIGVASRFADGTWRDATAPGCLCEGWGVSASGVSGFATIDNAYPGISNLTVDSFTSTATTATSSIHLTSMPGLTVTQAYAPSSAPTALFEDLVTITNNTGAAVTDVRYVRVMDWDIAPDEFNEYVTIQGTGTTSFLEKSHNDGFSTPDPLAFPDTPTNTYPIIDPSTVDADFIDNGTNDHGAYFRFNFGTLADGESYSFKIYYGAASDEASALAALSTIGAELYSLGQYSGDPIGGTPATYMFAFTGVGGTPIVDQVPEPASLLLMGSGLLGFAAMRRRFKK